MYKIQRLNNSAKYVCVYIYIYILIIQSFDWLAAFHLDLLQAILFIAVQLSAPVFLATCFKYCGRGLPTALLTHTHAHIHTHTHIYIYNTKSIVNNYWTRSLLVPF
jgi:hypothetical protein